MPYARKQSRSPLLVLWAGITATSVACSGSHRAPAAATPTEMDSGSPPSEDAAADAAPETSGPTDCPAPTGFKWTSTGPLVTAVPDATHPIVSVKDPSIVFFNNRWHIFATTADTSGNWSLVYTSFADWSEAASAPQYYLNQNPYLQGYHAAPQVFFFAPQNKWYLIFQSGQPQYTTNDDLSQPQAWTQPRNFFSGTPVATWLDFWIICDEANCFLFFSGDNGSWYRSQTSRDAFPAGLSDPVVVMSDPNKFNLFEGSATYSLKGTGKYLTMIEAIGPDGHRFYRSFLADALDGQWTPLADTPAKPFAGAVNVTFASGTRWTQDISHGEMIRDGYDERLMVDPCHLQFLYQGVDPAKANLQYSQIPYQLGLLTAAP